MRNPQAVESLEETGGIRRERIEALLSAVDAVLAALKAAALAGGASIGEGARARARTACARALGELAWMTEIIRSIKRELEDRDDREDRLGAPRRESSHSLSVH